MGTRFKQPGNILEHVATAAIAVDAVVLMGGVVGIAETAIADTETGSVAIDGVFTVPRTTGADTAWVQGDKIDFDVSAGEFAKIAIPAAGDIVACGVAAKAAADADTTGEILLTPGTGSVTA